MPGIGAPIGLAQGGVGGGGGDLLAANNLSDVSNAATSLSNLGGLGGVSDDTTPTLGGALAGGGYDVTAIGVLTLTEQAAAEANVAGQGQLWVKTASPNQLWFTADDGTAVQLGTGGGGDTYGYRDLGYKDFFIDPGATVLPDLALTVTNGVGVSSHYFDPAGGEFVYFTMVLPEDYVPGSDLKAKFFWDAATGASGNAQWGIQLRSFRNDDPLDTAWGTQATAAADTLLAVGDVHKTAASGAATVAGTSVAAGDLIQGRIELLAASTITVKGILMAAQLQYTQTGTPSAW